MKNFAFLLDDATGDWLLTPAYDLLFTPGPGGEHTMTLAGEGANRRRPHMLKLAEQASISTREAAAIIDAVQAAVSRWPHHAAQAGVTSATAQQIAQSLPQI